jgi:hypothetical protein
VSFSIREQFFSPTPEKAANKFSLPFNVNHLARSYYVVKRKKDPYRRYDEFRFFFRMLVVFNLRFFHLPFFVLYS